VNRQGSRSFSEEEAAAGEPKRLFSAGAGALKPTTFQTENHKRFLLLFFKKAGVS
jgi:hypothetical protein